jgi:hypothetical protein
MTYGQNLTQNLNVRSIPAVVAAEVLDSICARGFCPLHNTTNGRLAASGRWALILSGHSLMNRIISVLLVALLANAAIPCLAAEPAPAATQRAGKIEIADNAPDTYTVVKGDTLWGISGKFLKQPWRWPEVWRMNREQIRNPHWIYPGQVIVLDRNGPTLSIRGSERASGTTKLEPQIYATPMDTPLASIPTQAIQSFLIEPLVDDTETRDAPTVIGIQEGRVIAGTGDTIFAKNITPGVDLWNIYRRAKAITDPVTKRVLGYEAILVGSARVGSLGSGNKASVLQIVSSKHEINADDRLVPAGRAEIFSYVPHAPAADTEGHVVTIYDGLEETGRYGVITLSLGKAQGIEPGHVFALYRNRGEVTYKGDGRSEKYELPEQRYGLVFVFRVFNNLSYALVLDSSEPVRVADSVRAP